MQNVLTGRSQSRPTPALIAWLSLCLLVAAWLPAVPITCRTMWGYAALFGLAAALGLNGRTIDTLKRQAVIDGLTGLVTGCFMQNLLKHEVARSTRYNEPLSLLFADIDHFKQVNDRFGHSTGNHILRSVAQTIQQACRSCDTVARYGGEEFIVLLPHTPRDEAQRLAERVRGAVESLSVDLPGTGEATPVRVTISLGVANFPDDAGNSEDLVRYSDESMYAAKLAGRNRVALYGQTISRIAAPGSTSAPIRPAWERDVIVATR